MKFDQTFIAIRERSVLDILDLTLKVIRDHFVPLVVLWVLGIVPWIAMDLWLVHWVIDDYGSTEGYFLFFWLMMLLVSGQAQVGTLYMTRYLGDAMFEGHPSILGTIKECWKTTPYFWWSHLFVRMVIPIMFLVWCTRPGQIDFNPFFFYLLVPSVLCLGLLIRALRPFASEMLLLERTPIREKKEEKTVTYSKRSRALHVQPSSDLFGRFMTVCIFVVPMAVSFFALFHFLDSVLNLRAGIGVSLSPYYWTIALWMVAGFVVVSRFLFYIDLRIRQEGWAVELRMRAEAQRLARSWD